MHAYICMYVGVCREREEEEGEGERRIKNRNQHTLLIALSEFPFIFILLILTSVSFYLLSSSSFFRSFQTLCKSFPAHTGSLHSPSSSYPSNIQFHTTRDLAFNYYILLLLSECSMCQFCLPN